MCLANIFIPSRLTEKVGGIFNSLLYFEGRVIDSIITPPTPRCSRNIVPALERSLPSTSISHQEAFSIHIFYLSPSICLPKAVYRQYFSSSSLRIKILQDGFAIGEKTLPYGS